MWFITVFQNIELNDLGWVEFGDHRTWGYYIKRETAVQALHENWTDMREDLYDYAIIEKIGEGIASTTLERQWFKWDGDRNGYFEIDESEYMKHFSNFSIG